MTYVSPSRCPATAARELAGRNTLGARRTGRRPTVSRGPPGALASGSDAPEAFRCHAPLDRL
jgi:hypothetical protein